ncbi:myeloid leukemia factor 1-like [Ciona intestinalis]
MFRNMFKEFEEDPFFNEFSTRFPKHDDFGFRFAVIDDKRDHRRRSKANDEFMDPFQGMFRHMNKAIEEMHSGMENMKNDPNVHMYSSCSTMSYMNDGKSKPKIYQAASSTRRAPGAIKETHRAVRDSETGVEKMAVGQHIGPRGRIVEKRRQKGGHVEEERKFLDMDENDSRDFEREWKLKTGKLFPSSRGNEVENGMKGKFHRGIEGRSVARPAGPNKSGRNRH